MKKTALLAARDPSGMVEFASKLVESFEYQLLAVETVSRLGCWRIARWSISGMLKRRFEKGRFAVGGEFQQSNCRFPSWGPWKNALAEMDHDIVGLIRIAALNPIGVGVLGDSRLYSDTLELLAANHGVLPEEFRVRQACNALHAVAVFDASVAQFLESQSGEAP